MIGPLGAVVAAALLLTMLGLVRTFERSWWRVIHDVVGDTAPDSPEPL